MAANKRALVEIAVKQMGSIDGLAAAVQAHRTTVQRWLRGDVQLAGPALVAVLAVVKHPEEFAHHHRPRKPGGRKPKGK